MGPRMPKELAAPSTSSYSKSQFNIDVKEYREAVSGVPADAAKGIAAKPPDLQKALVLRNQIAYHVMADIESSYGGFEMKLTADRAVRTTLSDATVLGLTAATGLVGASDVKDILAATSSAFQGSWQSYDKNFFREKTTESIISQMRASRKSKQAELITNLANRDVTSYPWDAAWLDLIDFYYAGTVPSALVEISGSTGASAKLADVDLKIANDNAAKQAIGIRTVYEKLKAEALGTDPKKKTSATESLRTILTAAHYNPPANATPEQLVDLFAKAMSDADPDVDTSGQKQKDLHAAIADANLD